MDFQVRTEVIDPEQYYSLALSRRRLQRDDDEANGERGLLDAELGVRYVVNVRQLLMHDRQKQLAGAHFADVG